MTEILKLLEADGRLTAPQIAAILDRDPAEVEKIIAECEAERIILGYTAVIDWDKTKDELVSALIEVKIAPQLGDGFDRIAERIYQYEEVDSLYLVSGTFDLAVIIAGRSMKEIAQFVFARLAPIDGVTATSTCFLLKKYKEKHRIFYVPPEQEERIMFV